MAEHEQLAKWRGSVGKIYQQAAPGDSPPSEGRPRRDLESAVRGTDRRCSEPVRVLV